MKNLIHPILLFILLLGFLPGYTSVRLDAEKESVDNMCITPGTPLNPTGNAFSPNQAILDWSPGSPAGSPEITYFWVIGTTPDVTYGNGIAYGTTTDTWLGVISLYPGTTYYLRVYAHTSCNGSSSSYATSAAFTTPGGPSCVTPGTPVGVTATATGPTSASLDWFAGSPAGSSTVTYYWVVGTSPSVAWGSGTAQGSTTSTWVGVNSLLPGTTYYLRVYAHTSCNGSSSSYATSAPFTTPGGPSCVTPGTPVGVTATATGPTSASLDWFAGSPAGSSTVTYYWVVGTSPSVAWGSGTAQGSTTSTWVGVNSLLPGTTYYLRVYAHTSCNGSSSSYATSAAFTTPGGPSCVTPGTPVGVTATATGPTSASLDWFAGSPAGSSTVTYYWVVGTSPSVAWGSGTAQGSTTSTWVGVNSLLPGTTYYLRVYAHTSCNGSSSSYATSAAFTTPGGPSCVTPGTPVGVTATATGPTSASLDWFAGSPAGSSTVTYYWVVGTSPSVAWGSGTAQGSTTSTWVGVNSLLPGTTYYLRVYAHTSCNGSSSSYATSASFTTPGGPSCVTPGTPVGVTATATGQTSASLDWFAGSPAGSPNVTYYWVVGTSASVTYNSSGAVAQGNTSSTWVGVNSLLPGTTYYQRVYAHTSCNGSSSSYATSAAFTTPGGPSCVTPGTPVGVSATVTGSTSANLNWSGGSPAGSPTVTYYWVIGTSSSVTYGNGMTQGYTALTSFSLNNLQSGTTYYLRVYARTDCNGSVSSYATSAAFTTSGGCVAPSLQASNISFSNVSPQQFRIQWTNGNGTRRIVKINTLNGFTLPNNGSDPTPNSHYSGSGEQIVYNGTGNNVTVTGLPLNSTIWVRIFEANCSGVNSVYNIINSTNNPSSQRTITVLPAMSSFVGSEAGLNSNNEEIQIPFYTIRDFDESIPLMHLLSDGSTSTRFTLTASNARSFGFRVVDSIGRVVTDSNRTLDLARFGKLDTAFAVAHDKLVAKFTHPTIPHTSFSQNLKLQILYEGGLLGLDIPISFLRPAAPLAAELVDFSGKYLASQHVNQLQWTTLSEYNNDYFEIQRSIGNGDFEAIGKVSGINRPNLYSYTDHDIAPTGVHIYRLRQVDYDGTETLSDQIAIKVTGDTDVKTRISPNPATNLVHLQIEGNTEDNVRVKLFNMSGQRVISDMSEKMTGDVQIFELNTSSLQKGMYNLVIQIKDRIFHHKLLIVD